MHEYQAGTGKMKITLAVDIDTVGLAATRARLVVLNSTQPGVTVATSSDATGDILPEKEIGERNAVTSKRLSVLTKIDLTGTPQENKAEANRLTGTYVLDGGPNGSTQFDNPTKKTSPDFSTVILEMLIDLKP